MPIIRPKVGEYQPPTDLQDHARLVAKTAESLLGKVTGTVAEVLNTEPVHNLFDRILFGKSK